MISLVHPRILLKKGLSDLIGRIKGNKNTKKRCQSSERKSVHLISSKQLNYDTHPINKTNNQHLIDSNQVQLTNNEKLDTINETTRNSSRKQTVINENDYCQIVKVKGNIVLRNSTKDSNTSPKENNKGEKTKEIPSKLTFSEPINTIYQFPEPNDQNKSSPIGGILSSEQHKGFGDIPLDNPVQSSSNATKSSTKLINTAEASNRPRSSLLFTRHQKHKKMDRGLEAINKLILSVVGQSRGNCVIKSTPITEDYTIGSNVLGLGINGKVVECIRKVKPNDNTSSPDKPKK